MESILPYVPMPGDFTQIWPNDKMPNSKGMHLQNSIANERVYQALLIKNIPTSFHVFRYGGNAIALRNNTVSTEQCTTLYET